MLELENNELQGLKLQHDQKVNELEKIQLTILEVSISPVADTSVWKKRSVYPVVLLRSGS